ncbi:hypothetical protein [Mycobacteroides saopaulense]|uniref:Uncharacterized protein n=1 Tax=Mycobacteroides saopaulense TaxID=1578165 RepID=A0ABX3BYG8_9MYCO|nr:hypothetical protein [Mycobacteroides saopaulense]OHT86929.1 hypothetical protein BKG68_12670 [Mycobacteroides saopaulense]OHU08785.1 hypothetical protein BKG73_17365 [Mycobacteroides saopaulense]
MTDYQELRDRFIHYLTVDSETTDRRKRDYNAAIFDAQEGWACWSRTDLFMVLAKFDKAVKSLAAGGR